METPQPSGLGTRAELSHSQDPYPRRSEQSLAEALRYRKTRPTRPDSQSAPCSSTPAPRSAPDTLAQQTPLLRANRHADGHRCPRRHPESCTSDPQTKLREGSPPPHPPETPRKARRCRYTWLPITRETAHSSSSICGSLLPPPNCPRSSAVSRYRRYSITGPSEPHAETRGSERSTTKLMRSNCHKL